MEGPFSPEWQLSDNQYSRERNRRAGRACSAISSAVFSKLSEICRLGFPESEKVYLVLQMDFSAQDLLAQRISVQDNKLFGGLSGITSGFDILSSYTQGFHANECALFCLDGSG